MMVIKVGISATSHNSTNKYIRKFRLNVMIYIQTSTT